MHEFAKWTIIGQMAIAKALPGLNDLGRWFFSFLRLALSDGAIYFFLRNELSSFVFSLVVYFLTVSNVS